MNWRAPYSPPLRPRNPRAARKCTYRHDDTHPQIDRNHRPARPRRGVVAAGYDGGADAVAGELRAAAGDLLCGRRHRMGAAGDADHQLDVEAGRLGSDRKIQLVAMLPATLSSAASAPPARRRRRTAAPA